MSSNFSTAPWADGVNCGFKIGEFSDQSQKSTGLKHTAHLFTQLSQHDLPFSRLNFLNRFKNDAQTVTGNMTEGRKIENKPVGTLSNRAVEKFMQFVGRHFIDIASGSDDKHLTTGFGMYRHVLNDFIKIKYNKSIVSRLR